MFRERYADVFDGDEHWQGARGAEGQTYAWDGDSTYVQHPPFFEDMPTAAGGVRPTSAAPACWRVLGDSVTTDHISPAGTITKDSPGRQVPDRARGVEPTDFNSYGSRRGNHEVMMRGTFANIRIRNQLAPGTEGGVTVHMPDGEQMSIYDAAMKYQAEGMPLVVIAGQGVRHRLVARLGREGHLAAGRQGGDRRELRAHPPLEPGRHGRSAAAVPGRHDAQDAEPRRQRDASTSPA